MENSNEAYAEACEYFKSAAAVTSAALRKYPELPKSEHYDPAPAIWLELEARIESYVSEGKTEKVIELGKKLVEAMRREIWRQVKAAGLN